MKWRFFLIFVLLISFSCAGIKLKSTDKNDHYFYHIGSGGMIKNTAIEILDSTTWNLHSIRIIPTNLNELRLGGNDSFLLHRPKADTELEYRFSPSTGEIVVNENVVGSIYIDTFNIDSSLSAKEGRMLYNTTRYYPIFEFQNSNDSIITNRFHIVHINDHRLHLEHLRINKKTKEEERVRLVFYYVNGPR